jgi:hypothetical protein
MSEVPQGPGWWQASDGKWYAPDLFRLPQGNPPPPTQTATPTLPGYPQYIPAAPSTNGLAIASFVFSLLWLAGLGSLLAIIFAASARRKIKRSRGRETGDGLAIAGLVIGILGLLGSLVFYATVAAIDHGVHQADDGLHVVIPTLPTTPTTTTPVAALGQALNVSAYDHDGISTVTVYSVKYPVDDSSGQPDTFAGKEYAAADIQVCAGASGSQNGTSAFMVDLLFPNGESVSSDSAPPSASPYLGFFYGIGANQCVRGFLTFEIASGTIPTGVQYSPDFVHNYQWTLPTR